MADVDPALGQQISWKRSKIKIENPNTGSSCPLGDFPSGGGAISSASGSWAQTEGTGAVYSKIGNGPI
jgi:hypothetical protein